MLVSEVWELENFYGKLEGFGDSFIVVFGVVFWWVGKLGLDIDGSFIDIWELWFDGYGWMSVCINCVMWLVYNRVGVDRWFGEFLV